MIIFIYLFCLLCDDNNNADKKVDFNTRSIKIDFRRLVRNGMLDQCLRCCRRETVKDPNKRTDQVQKKWNHFFRR